MGLDEDKMENLVDGMVVNCEIGWCFSYISFPILHRTKLLKPTPPPRYIGYYQILPILVDDNKTLSNGNCKLLIYCMAGRCKG